MKKYLEVKSEVFTPESIEKIEKHYNARYICDSCLKTMHNGWANFPAAFFYQEEVPEDAPPGSTNWFALYYRPSGSSALMITNAEGSLEPDLDGIVAEDGEIIYSRYRHDCRKSSDDSVMIDGGRDYFRGSIAPMVKLKITPEGLEILENTP